MADNALPEGWEAVKSGSTCAPRAALPVLNRMFGQLSALKSAVSVYSGETYYRNTHTDARTSSHCVDGARC